MTINIPDEVLKSAELTAGEFLIDVAVYLYDKERLSFGQARKLSGLDVLGFQKALADRNVFLKYGVEDMERDVKNLGLK